MSSWDVTPGWDDTVANDQHEPTMADEDRQGLEGSDSTSTFPQDPNMSHGAFLTPPVCTTNPLKS